MTTWKPNT